MSTEHAFEHALVDGRGAGDAVIDIPRVTRELALLRGLFEQRPADHPLPGNLAWAEPHPSSSVQVRALHALIDIDDPRVTTILLDSFPRYGSYRGVIEALTRHRDPALVEPLIQYLTHPDHFVREAACEALGILQDTRATLPLVARLEDSHMMVRRAAAFALADLRDTCAADTVLRHWQGRPDEDINVRMGLRAALDAMGVHYDKRGLRSLQAQPEADPLPLGHASAAMDVAAPVPVVASRDDLFWFMWAVHNALEHLLHDGTAGYFGGHYQGTQPKPADLPWKLGRSSGRRLRQRLKHLEVDVLQTERRWPADSTNLPSGLAEQGSRMLSRLKAMIAILEADEDARFHIDQMRAYIREMQDFLEALPLK